MLYWRMACAAFIVSTTLALPAHAQTTRVSPTGPGIGLTQDHRRTIYREIGSQPPQRVPEGAPDGNRQGNP